MRPIENGSGLIDLGRRHHVVVGVGQQLAGRVLAVERQRHVEVVVGDLPAQRHLLAAAVIAAKYRRVMTPTLRMNATTTIAMRPPRWCCSRRAVERRG